MGLLIPSNPNIPSSTFTPEKDPSKFLHQLQEAVGGYVEIIHISDGRIIVVHEDELLVRPDSPYNQRASMLADMSGRTMIFGTAVALNHEEYTDIL